MGTFRILGRAIFSRLALNGFFALLILSGSVVRGAESEPLTACTGATIAWKLIKQQPDFGAIASAAASHMPLSDDAARQATADKLAAQYKQAFDAISPAQKHYSFAIRSSVNEYDHAAGGYHLQTFYPGAGADLGAAPADAPIPYPVATKIAFTNACDFDFIKCDEKATETYFGAQETLDFNMEVIPLFAARELPIEGADPDAPLVLYCHIVSLQAATIHAGAEKSRVCFTINAPTTPDKATSPISTGTKPTALAMERPFAGIVWHKLAGKSPPHLVDRAKYANSVQHADEFDRPAALKHAQIALQAMYDEVDPKGIYCTETAVNLGDYDFDKQGFPIQLGDGSIGIYSYYPFSAPEVARHDQFLYQLHMANMDALSVLKLPPAQGKSLLTELKGSRSLTLRTTFQVQSAKPVSDENSDKEPRLMECQILTAQFWKDNYLPLGSEIVLAQPMPGTAAAAVAAGEPAPQAAPAPAAEGTPPNSPAAEAAAPPVAPPTPAPESPAPPPAPPESPAPAPAAAPAGGSGTDLDPANADIKGLKLGIPAADFISAAKDKFPTIRYDATNMPDHMQLMNAGTGEQMLAIVDQDGKMYSMKYVRKLDADQGGDAIDAVLKKYGPAVSDSGPVANAKGATIRTLKWNKPGSLQPPSAGVMAELIEAKNSKSSALVITITLSGHHVPMRMGAAPGGGAPATGKKLDL